jgi:hypothetical protein
MDEQIRICDVIALQCIFDSETLKTSVITKKTALECGKKWRIKTKSSLVLFPTDDGILCELKKMINALPTCEDPLSKDELVVLGVLMYNSSAHMWLKFTQHNRNAEFSFEYAVKLLQRWADWNTPHALPDRVSEPLKRVVAALTVDPMMTQMYCLVTKELFNGRGWKDVFEFYRAMHKMNQECDTSGRVLYNYEYVCLYGVKSADFPFGWNDKMTRNFAALPE